MLFYVVTTIIGLTLVVLAVVFLRHRGILKREDSKVINNLLLYLVLPADIIYQLMRAPLNWGEAKMVATLVTIAVVDLAIAYAIGRILRRRPAEIGALMLTTGFAATGFIGWPVLYMLYPNDIAMHADLIVVSELGMSLPTLILAPIIAQVFGEVLERRAVRHVARDAIQEYVRSPIFHAIVVGSVLAVLDFQLGDFVGDIFNRLLEAASNGGNFLPLALLGLMLKPGSLRGAWSLVIAAVILQGMVDPMITNVLADVIQLAPPEREVMMILTMTPAAILPLTFAERYRCAPDLAAGITFASVIAMVVTFPLMYSMLM